MSAVVEFKKKEPADPHLSGNAQCFGCQHKWVAVVPVGITEFECPSCHTLKGRFRLICEPTGKHVWRCPCGCDLFMIVKDEGAMCINCGIYQRW